MPVRDTDADIVKARYYYGCAIGDGALRHAKRYWQRQRAAHLYVYVLIKRCF